MTTTVERPWVREMVVVHRVFRRESRNLPLAVAACRPGDTARAAFLAGMARGYIKGLHDHHTGEDELLWPKLLARVDLDADMVLRMEQQHHVVAEGLGRVEHALAAWERTAGAAERDALVAELHRHRADLLVHLDEEEQHVLPLIHEHMTVQEWNELSEHSRAKTPKDQLLFVLGALLEEATPDETARFMALLPTAARLAYRLFGKRAYDKRMREVRTA
ncbi:hemerythrin domain-containing protein [Dactylosporangium sp. NPDC000555]|uniref:hemerythrin domain-containing protein n=1 Tax=Dactylosporangium sp. NPDC000555 TaxID=3154260 RepID=UPI00332EF5E6